MVKVRAHGQPLKGSPPLARRYNRAVGPFVSGFRLQIGVANNRLLHLRFTLLSRVGNLWERLGRTTEQFAQARSVECLIISSTNCPGGIQRLPTRGYLWSLSGSAVAKVVIPFLVVDFQTVPPREIPGRAGYRHAQFPKCRPNVPAAFCRSEVRRTSRLSRSGQRIWVIAGVLSAMFTADSE